jgi:T5SS/PEP-CTERM-associated repeat protein
MSGSGTTASLEGGRAEFGDIVYGTLFQVADEAGSRGEAIVKDAASMKVSADAGTYTGIQIADGEGSNGSLTITGTGSSIEIDGNGDDLAARTASVEVGAAGTGSLTLEEGGRLTLEANGVMSVGTEVDGVGTVTVNGASSVLDAGGLMIIGAPMPNDSVDRSALELSGGGEGTVTVGAGATLRAGEAQGDGIGDIFIGENGTLRVEDGGTVEADVVNDAGGSFITGNSPGWAAIDGDFDSSGDLRMEFAGTGEGEYDRLDVTGEAVLSGLVTLDFSLDEGLESGDRFTVIEADEGLDMAGAELDVVGLADGLSAETRVTDTSLEVALV